VSQVSVRIDEERIPIQKVVFKLYDWFLFSERIVRDCTGSDTVQRDDQSPPKKIIIPPSWLIRNLHKATILFVLQTNLASCGSLRHTPSLLRKITKLRDSADIYA